MLSEFVFYGLGRRRGRKSMERVLEFELDQQACDKNAPEGYPSGEGVVAELAFLFGGEND